MDVRRVIVFLREQRDLLEEQYVPDPYGGEYLGWQTVHSRDEAESARMRAELVLDRLTPRWRSEVGTSRETAFDGLRLAITRAIAAMGVREELEDMLGDGAPELSAGTFHPWVWDSAKTLWGSGHYRDAVSAAAKGINAQAQAKVERRDASEWKLLAESFSLKAPEPEKPRLRLMADDGSDTFKAMHEGAGAYARGLYQGIRNPANHDQLPELSEGEGLEQLAAFSVLARWVDGAAVEKV